MQNVKWNCTKYHQRGHLPNRQSSSPMHMHAYLKWKVRLTPTLQRVTSSKLERVNGKEASVSSFSITPTNHLQRLTNTVLWVEFAHKVGFSEGRVLVHARRGQETPITILHNREKVGLPNPSRHWSLGNISASNFSPLRGLIETCPPCEVL